MFKEIGLFYKENTFYCVRNFLKALNEVTFNHIATLLFIPIMFIILFVYDLIIIVMYTLIFMPLFMLFFYLLPYFLLTKPNIEHIKIFNDLIIELIRCDDYI